MLKEQGSIVSSSPYVWCVAWAQEDSGRGRREREGNSSSPTSPIAAFLVLPVPQNEMLYTNYPQSENQPSHRQLYGLSPREQPSPLLPPFEPSRAPPELANDNLDPTSHAGPSNWGKPSCHPPKSANE